MLYLIFVLIASPIIIFGAYVLYFVFSGSFAAKMLAGHTGVSYDISNARDNGVLVYQLNPELDKISIDDNIEIVFKEIWLEKQWKYGYKGNEIFDEYFQLCILSPSIGSYGKDWVIFRDKFPLGVRFAKNEILYRSLPKDYLNKDIKISIHKQYLGRKIEESLIKEIILLPQQLFVAC